MSDMTLRVSFDVDQISECLYWTLTDGRIPEPAPSGKENGTFPLTAGKTFGIEVEATGIDEGVTITLIDAFLTTLPILFSRDNQCGAVPGVYPYPSPFFDPANVQQGATARFTFGEPKPDVAQTRIWDSRETPLVLNGGRWDTSFALTVAITANGATRYRVFGFDPETESSSGATPPN